MIQWEYLIEIFKPYHNESPTKYSMDQLGDDGWELVHVQHTNAGEYHFYFKRQKKASS